MTYFSQLSGPQGGGEKSIEIDVADSEGGVVREALVPGQQFSDVVVATHLGRAGYAYLVDARGAPIAYPNRAVDDAYTGGRIKSLTVLPQVAEGLGSSRTGSATGRNFSRTHVLSAWATVPSTGWRVFVEQPQSEVFAPLRGTVWRTVLLLLAFVAGAVALAVLLAGRLVRPIKRMQVAAAAIGGGAYQERIELDRRDELGDLAQTFNRMAASLQELITGLEWKVAERTRELEMASRHKSDFLANMSHELRTPLNAILGFSQVLQEQLFGEVNEKQREYLDDILSSANHLLSLINDILDLAKVEAGQVELEMAAFSLREALERGIVMVREKASTNGHPARARARSVRRRDRGRRAPHPPGRLQPALERGQVHARGRPGRRDQRRATTGEVTISVRDTGPGIAPDDRELIFEEFQAGALCRRRAPGGHRPRPRALPEVRRASRRPHLGRERGRQGQSLLVHPSRRVALMEGSLVLVVEDNEKNMKLVRDVLQAKGYRTLEATTGEQAVELAREHVPDLILMDIQLPGIDGVTALGRLREDETTAGTTVVALTAQAMQGDRESFLEAGFDGYISKPIDVPEFIRAVARYCDG